jgi:RimJ/RimL family protein N-acetyltransferase
VNEDRLRGPACAALARRVERTCVSRERFLERGLGFCLLRGSTLVSSCFSAFVEGTAHEIKINTFVQGYRRKGLATWCARAYVDHCLANGLTPVWTTSEANAASVGLAAKLGFERIGEHPAYVWHLAGGMADGGVSTEAGSEGRGALRLRALPVAGDRSRRS